MNKRKKEREKLVVRDDTEHVLGDGIYFCPYFHHSRDAAPFAWGREADIFRSRIVCILPVARMSVG